MEPFDQNSLSGLPKGHHKQTEIGFATIFNAFEVDG